MARPVCAACPSASRQVVEPSSSGTRRCASRSSRSRSSALSLGRTAGSGNASPSPGNSAPVVGPIAISTAFLTFGHMAYRSRRLLRRRRSAPRVSARLDRSFDRRRSGGRRSVRAGIRAANRRYGHAPRAATTGRVDDARHGRDRLHRAARRPRIARQRAQGRRSRRARLPARGTVHSRRRPRRGTARDRVRRGHGAAQRRDPTPPAERDRPHGDDHRPRLPRHEPDDRDSGEHPRNDKRPRGDVGLRRRPCRELLLDRRASERRIPADRRQPPHRARRRRGRVRTSTARPRPPPSCCASRTTRHSASTSGRSARPRSTGSG